MNVVDLALADDVSCVDTTSFKSLLVQQENLHSQIASEHELIVANFEAKLCNLRGRLNSLSRELSDGADQTNKSDSPSEVKSKNVNPLHSTSTSLSPLPSLQGNSLGGKNQRSTPASHNPETAVATAKPARVFNKGNTGKVAFGEEQCLPGQTASVGLPVPEQQNTHIGVAKNEEASVESPSLQSGSSSEEETQRADASNEKSSDALFPLRREGSGPMTLVPPVQFQSKAPAATIEKRSDLDSDSSEESSGKDEFTSPKNNSVTVTTLTIAQPRRNTLSGLFSSLTGRSNQSSNAFNPSVSVQKADSESDDNVSPLQPSQSRRTSAEAAYGGAGSRRQSLIATGSRRPSLLGGPGGSRRQSLIASGSRRPSLALPGMGGMHQVASALADVSGDGKSSRRTSRCQTDFAPRHSGTLLEDGQGRRASRCVTEFPPMKPQFELWSVWSDSLMDREDDPDRWERISNVSRHSAAIQAYRQMNSVDLDTHEEDCCPLLQPLVTHPSSIKRMLWVVLSGAFIMYDMIFIPLHLSFEFEEGTFVQAVALTAVLFWTMDLVMSFFIGFHESGRLQMRLEKVASNYGFSWFPFDLFLVLIDWTLLVLVKDDEADGVEATRAIRTAKTFRMSRALRSLRLLRVMRIPEVMKDFSYIIGRSEYTSLTLGLLKHVLAILMVNHVIACAWFVIGDRPGGWVEEYMLYETDEMRYFTALHWSLTQFTPATMAVQPQNFVERFFAVGVLMFALITFSSFVSSITNLMTHLRTLRSSELKQFAKLERFCHDRGISFHLSVRVRRYLEHVVKEKSKNLDEADIELLKHLSTPLHMELRWEVHNPLLSKHLFFHYFGDFNLQIMQRVCLEAVSTTHMGSGDSLFAAGDQAHSMFFIQRGNLIYSKQGGRPAAGHANVDMVEDGQHFCELVLWTRWEHRGVMRALQEVSLLCVKSTKFHEILSKNKSAIVQPATYAAAIVTYLNDQDRSDLSDLLSVQLTNTYARDAFQVDELSSNGSEHGHGKTTLARVFGGVANPLQMIKSSRNSVISRCSVESDGSITRITRNTPDELQALPQMKINKEMATVVPGTAPT